MRLREIEREKEGEGERKREKERERKRERERERERKREKKRERERMREMNDLDTNNPCSSRKISPFCEKGVLASPLASFKVAVDGLSGDFSSVTGVSSLTSSFNKQEWLEGVEQGRKD